MYDALVIGGGPAGLQAALTLGRMHRTVLLIDSGQYRNDPVAHAHNFVTHDGRAPAELRRLAREDLEHYATVEMREGTVERVRETGDGFVAETDGEPVEARTLVLATGMRDELPDVPGLADAWGAEVANCPFCHGHEFADRPIGLLGDGPSIGELESMLAPIGSEVITFGRDDLTKVERTDDGLLAHRPDGDPVELAGLFLHPSTSQAAPFAEDLGLDILSSGCVRVDALCRTSHPRVFAAGDLAHVEELPVPMPSILAALAAGQAAGASAVRFLANPKSENEGNPFTDAD
ncbi:NAD(P)/FAD-dependent oxidoreductase [Aeromicrobium duanguangcaii]|uniref:NAD(P)/FAD-dependent oxidoreductase n=1 Tax=Aeromicrobium duanguangcaii TaxID=2968086 RepID=A0ABY5KG70_9ACTN|nr:NAD(P)/FAD-dependent oxidoreductase [Aeromicrobium duanguangcaii]MCD9153440.1 NAD(P)/FAD-dependent oxidoreductase [Aeromicrobium duanguangcaii]UUI69469.1 NAD(P)/FAD-dependent oxidoreductase [Aeromicrobium duanguangcaii]